MYVLSQPRRLAVDWNHTRLVDHRVPDADAARALLDARPVAVDGRQNRADDSARNAAIVIAVEFGGVVLAREAPAVERRWPSAVSAGRRPLGGSMTSDEAC